MTWSQFLGCFVLEDGGKKCSLSQGPCNDDNECIHNLICIPGACGIEGSGCCIEPYPCNTNHTRKDSCCSPLNLCGLNEGHCRSSRDCMGNLQCGTRNCDWHSELDCCTTPYNPGGNFHFFQLIVNKYKN